MVGLVRDKSSSQLTFSATALLNWDVKCRRLASRSSKPNTYSLIPRYSAICGKSPNIDWYKGEYNLFFLTSNLFCRPNNLTDAFSRSRLACERLHYYHNLVNIFWLRFFQIFNQNSVLMAQVHGPATSLPHDEVGQKQWVSYSCMTRFRQGSVGLGKTPGIIHWIYMGI